MIRFILFLQLMSLSVCAELVQCEQPREIAQKAYDRDDGQDSWAEVEMSLIDSDGSSKVRKVIMAAKDFGELTKRYIKFTEPAVISGTAFLAIERYEDRDEQFLYLPSVRRVRRIAGDQKDRSFVNTDFTYEDLERRKVERDEFKLLGDGSHLGRSAWLLERRAKEEDDSQYERSVSWIDKSAFIVLKSEMYKQGNLVKRMEAHELKKIDGIWTITDVTMHDLVSNHKTKNRILNIKYNKGVPDDVFTQKYLEKK